MSGNVLHKKANEKNCAVTKSRRKGKPTFPEINKRIRSVIPSHVLKKLEKTYQMKCYITITEKLMLSKEVGMTPFQVQTWFQNRRTKDRKQG